MSLFDRVKRLWVAKYGWNEYKREDVALCPNHVMAVGPVEALIGDAFKFDIEEELGVYVGPPLSKLRYRAVRVPSAGDYDGTLLASALSILGEGKPKGRVNVCATKPKGRQPATEPYPLLLVRDEVGILIAPELDVSPAVELNLRRRVYKSKKGPRLVVGLRLPPAFALVKAGLEGWA